MKRSIVVAGRTLVWDAEQYVRYKGGFQGSYADEFLHRKLGTSTLAERLAQARRVLDFGCGDGSHTVSMAALMPPEGSMMGLDMSEEMIEAARVKHLLPTTSGPVDFVAEDISRWETRERLRRKHDLCTSFMALHWVPETELLEVLRSIADALRRPLSGGCPGPGWFVASHHSGPESMKLLVDAVHATIRRGGMLSHLEDVQRTCPSVDWTRCFPNGCDDWEPITMLPIEAWRDMLHDAGFDVSNKMGAVENRTVDTPYVGHEGVYERLAAAWGPMFPTLPTTELRNAFFMDVAVNAMYIWRGSTRGGGQPSSPPVVVRNLVVDIAVPVR
jgi:SAM-dependent methyltransferase